MRKLIYIIAFTLLSPDFTKAFEQEDNCDREVRLSFSALKVSKGDRHPAELSSPLLLESVALSFPVEIKEMTYPTILSILPIMASNCEDSRRRLAIAQRLLERADLDPTPHLRQFQKICADLYATDNRRVTDLLEKLLIKSSLKGQLTILKRELQGKL